MELTRLLDVIGVGRNQIRKKNNSPITVKAMVKLPDRQVVLDVTDIGVYAEGAIIYLEITEAV